MNFSLESLLSLFSFSPIVFFVFFLSAAKILSSKLTHILNVVFNLFWTVLVFLLFFKFNELGNSDFFPVVLSYDWLSVFVSRFTLGLDSLNLPLLVLTAVISLSLSFYIYGKEKLNRYFIALFWLLNACSILSLLSVDLFLFYFMWELMLVPMYFLIGKWGGKNRIYATLKFFLMTMAGSLLLFVAIAALVHQYSLESLSWHNIYALKLPYSGMWSAQGLFFMAFLAAFAVKVPLWPFHTWLPDAHSEAPTAASVVLAAVLLKLGIYGILRWCLPLFPEASYAASHVVCVLAVIGIILGALAAIAQSDFKRLIAYSSVSHLGFMVLGLFSFQVESVQGALFQNIAHGLSAGLLFLIFGIIYDRVHSRDIADYGGLASLSTPLTFFFLLASFASIGLPGLPGFIGEFLILTGSFFYNKYYAVLALSGVLLGAIYMLRLIAKAFWGPVSEKLIGINFKLQWNEWLSILTLVVFLIVLGLMPGLLTSLSEEQVTETLLKMRN